MEPSEQKAKLQPNPLAEGEGANIEERPKILMDTHQGVITNNGTGGGETKEAKEGDSSSGQPKVNPNSDDDDSDDDEGVFEGPVSHGTLRFVSGDSSLQSSLEGNRLPTRSVVENEALFMRVDEHRDQHRTNGIYHWMLSNWAVPEPELLVSVTGAADVKELSPNHILTFKRDVADLATKANAWIVTGGSNFGVMRFVGDIIGSLKLPITLIGIATYEKVIGFPGGSPGPLHYAQHDCIEYNAMTSKINPYYTHFIFVSNDSIEKGHQWGQEVILRTNLEKSIIGGSKPNRLSVQIVVSGGPQTLRTVMESVRMGIPLVVYEFSGRVGDVLACLYYARLLEKSTSLTVPKAAAAARSPAEAADYFGGEAVPGVEPTWNRSWSDDNVIAEALRLRSFPTPANPFLIQAWFVLCREHANESGRGRKPFNLQKKWKEVMYIYRIATIRLASFTDTIGPGYMHLHPLLLPSAFSGSSKTISSLASRVPIAQGAMRTAHVALSASSSRDSASGDSSAPSVEHRALIASCRELLSHVRDASIINVQPRKSLANCIVSTIVNCNNQVSPLPRIELAVKWNACSEIQQLLNHIERVSAKQAAALSERQSSQVTLVNYKDVTRRVLYTLLAILCAKYDRGEMLLAALNSGCVQPGLLNHFALHQIERNGSLLQQSKQLGRGKFTLQPSTLHLKSGGGDKAHRLRSALSYGTLRKDKGKTTVMEQLQQAWENPEPKDEVVKGWTPGDLVQYSITLWYRTLERQRAKRWYLCFCCRSRPPSATSSPAERRSNGCYAQLKDNLRRWKKRLKRIFVAKRSRGALYPLHSLLKPIAPGVGATYSSCQRARLCGLLHHTRDSAESRKIEALLHLSGRESEQFHSQLVAEATDLWSGVAVQYEESAIAIIRFLWAILAGRYQVARVLWQKSEQPLRAALVAVYFLQLMSDYHKSTASEAEREAALYEALAIELIMSVGNPLTSNNDGKSSSQGTKLLSSSKGKKHGPTSQSALRDAMAQEEGGHWSIKDRKDAMLLLRSKPGREWEIVDLVARRYFHQHPLYRRKQVHPRGLHSFSCVELAILTNCKELLSTTIVQELTTKLWSGRVRMQKLRLRFDPDVIAAAVLKYQRSNRRREGKPNTLRRSIAPPTSAWKSLMDGNNTEAAAKGQKGPTLASLSETASKPPPAPAPAPAQSQYPFLKSSLHREFHASRVAATSTKRAEEVSYTALQDMVEGHSSARWSLTPKRKFVLHILLQLVFLIGHATLVMRERDQRIEALEWVLYAWVISAFIGDRHQRFGGTLMFWEQFSAFSSVMFLCAFVLRVVGWAAGHDATSHVGWATLGLSVILSCLKFLDVMSMSRVYGQLALAIGNILTRDLVAFFVLLIILLMGFGFAFVSVFLYSPDEPDSLTPLADLFWALLGDWTLPLDVDANAWLLGLFLAVFIMSGTIVMINLLIAMMSDTFARIRVNVEKEWKYVRTRKVYTYLSAPLTVPIFNIIISCVGSCFVVLRMARRAINIKRANARHSSQSLRSAPSSPSSPRLITSQSVTERPYTERTATNDTASLAAGAPGEEGIVRQTTLKHLRRAVSQPALVTSRAKHSIATVTWSMRLLWKTLELQDLETDDEANDSDAESDSDDEHTVKENLFRQWWSRVKAEHDTVKALRHARRARAKARGAGSEAAGLAPPTLELGISNASSVQGIGPEQWVAKLPSLRGVMNKLYRMSDTVGWFLRDFNSLARDEGETVDEAYRQLYAITDDELLEIETALRKHRIDDRDVHLWVLLHSMGNFDLRDYQNTQQLARIRHKALNSFLNS